MKKIIGLTLTAVLGTTLLLAGCGKKDAASGGNSPSPDAAGDKQVTLKYAAWNDDKIIQATIKSFEAAHPNIKIERDKTIDWPWDEKMAASAAAGKLPDVFWVFSVPPSVQNGWLEDLTPYLKDDKEYDPSKVFNNLNETGAYNGHQFALPHSLYAMGVFVNLDLLAKENITPPQPNWTLDDMRNIAIKATKFNDHQFGISGIGGMKESIIPQFDPAQGWLTWDGKQYNFDKPAFADAIKFVNGMQFNDKVTPDTYKDEEKAKWFGKLADGKPESGWKMGKVAMTSGATWDFPWMTKDLKFKWAFLPVPGKNGQRTPLVTDYIGMSKNSQHKKEAMEFIKWMTYSKEGWLSRLQNEDPIASIPLINDEAVWSGYLSQKTTPAGMKDVLKLIPNGFVDGFKWLPGYQDVFGKVVGPNYQKFEKGEAKPEDMAADFQQKSNQAYKDAIDKINAVAK